MEVNEYMWQWVEGARVAIHTSCWTSPGRLGRTLRYTRRFSMRTFSSHMDWNSSFRFFRGPNVGMYSLLYLEKELAQMNNQEVVRQEKN